MKPLIIIQARLNSSRLPGKVLKTILNRPLLYYLFKRLSYLKTEAKLVLATTVNSIDDPLEKFCIENQVLCFRGDEDNVLERFYKTASKYPSKIIVRVTADCPLLDPSILDKMLSFYIQHFPKYDYLSNVLNRRYPKGLDLEVFSFKGLEKAYFQAKDPYQKEHVTPYFYQNPELFSLYSFEDSDNFSSFNISVDDIEDFQRVKAIIEKYYPQNPNFGLKEIKSYLSTLSLEQV